MMAIKDIFKINRKTFFYPSAWFDIEGTVRTNKTLFSVLKDLFVVAKPEITEDYEAALQRQGLSDEQAQTLGNQYKKYALGLLFIGLFCLSFGIVGFLMSFLHWRATLFFTLMAALLFAQAFRYDFWGMQIRVRKLGCNFQDWRRQYWT